MTKTFFFSRQQSGGRFTKFLQLVQKFPEISNLHNLVANPIKSTSIRNQSNKNNWQKIIDENLKNLL